jgi:hypothetical protein
MFGGGVALVLALASAPAPAGSNTQLKVLDARIGERSLMSGTTDKPIVFDPRQRTLLLMTVRNDGPAPVAVSYLRVSGSLLGIPFARYQAGTPGTVAPGETRTITALGDFFDIASIANGYVNASLQAVEVEAVGNRHITVATQGFDAKIRGSLWSSEGLLFLQVVAFSLISLIDIAIGVSRRRLPHNRFIRALLFGVAAASTVLTIVIGAAMASIALFDSSAWVPAVLLATAAGFALGYLSPGRLERTAAEAAEDRVIDLVAAGAVARASGEFARRTTGEVASHASGDHTGLAASHHDSGEFAPPPHHDSGEFAPPPHHDSGSHEPPVT